MPTYDMFGEKYSGSSALDFHYGADAKLIQDLRARHLAEGGDPIDFPKYLEEAGVKAVGQFIVVQDEFALMAKLKFAK